MGAGVHGWAPCPGPRGFITVSHLPPRSLAVGLHSIPPRTLAVGWTAGDGCCLPMLTWMSGLPPWPPAVACSNLPPAYLAVAKRVRSRNTFRPGQIQLNFIKRVKTRN
jgi:hypothetical protein